MSLRIKIFIGLIGVACILISIIGGTSYIQSQYQISRQMIDRLQGIADSKERRVLDVVTQYLDDAKNIAHAASAGSGIDDLKLKYPQLESVSEVVVSSDAPRADITNIYTDQFSRPLLDIVVAQPTQDHTDAGLLVTMSASWFVDIAEDRAGLSNTGEVLFVSQDESGKIVFINQPRFSLGSDFYLQLQSEDDQFVSEISQSGEERVIRDGSIRDYRGEKVFAVTRFIEPIRLGLVVKVDQDDALSFVHTLLQTYIWILVLSIVLVAIISFLVARVITHPLEILLQAVDHVKEGNFDMPAEINSRDEFGRLGRSFNKMAKKIQKSHLELEKRVERKTHELAEQLEFTESAKKRAVELLEVVKHQKLKVASEKAKIEAVLESVGNGLIAVDNDRKIIMMNETAEEMLAVREKNIVGQTWPLERDIVDEDGTPISMEKLPTVITLESGKKCINSSCQLVRKNGSMFDASITSTPIMYEGEIIGAVTMFRDITREKEVDRAKTEFVSLASHQLRTPLASVNWYTEMLLDGDAGELTEDQHMYLTEIFKGNKRMIDLVADLLNVSRLDLGTFVVKSDQIEPLEISRSVIKELELFVQEKSITIREIYGKEISSFFGDENLMRILFLNLLSNAIRYSPKAGTIDLELSTVMKGGEFGGRKVAQDSLVYSVKDEGIGIPLHQQDKIFKKLFRADNARALESNGTGLGLYIVKSIVDQSSGEVWFESQPGKGTTFYLTLPLTGMTSKRNVLV